MNCAGTQSATIAIGKLSANTVEFCKVCSYRQKD